MTSQGNFLCGCKPADKRHYSGDTIPSPVTGEPIYTDKRYDESGFEVCPEHGERMYGYASPAASDQAGFRPDFSNKGSGSFKSWPELDVTDLRDNRDPEEVYAEMKREKAQVSNGHA